MSITVPLRDGESQTLAIPTHCLVAPCFLLASPCRRSSLPFACHAAQFPLRCAADRDTHLPRPPSPSRYPCGDAPTSSFAAPPREAVCLPHGVYGCKKKRTKNRRTQDAGKTPNQATNEHHATLYFANHSAHRAHETCGDVRRRRELYHTGRGGVNGACARGRVPCVTCSPRHRRRPRCPCGNPRMTCRSARRS